MKPCVRQVCATTLACLFLVVFNVSAGAQGVPGVLHCDQRGGLDVHASRDPGSAVVARIQCGEPVLIIEQRFGSPHIRLEDGKDGYIIGLNFGQWSLQSESPGPASPAAAPLRAPGPSATAAPSQPQETRPLDDNFRRFDIDWVLLSYNRQGHANLYGGDLAFNTNLNPHLGIVADVAVHQAPAGTVQFGDLQDVSKLTVIAYRFGPRIYGFRGRRISTFGEFLAGGARAVVEEKLSAVSASLVVRDHVNGFSAAFGGGMDFQIKPWLMWRVYHVDFSYLHFPDINSSGLRAGTGLAFQFGH